MGFLRLLKRSVKRKSALGVIAAVAAICSGPALATPAYSQITPRAAALSAADISGLTNVPTLQSQDSSSAMANLPVTPATMSCDDTSYFDGCSQGGHEALGETQWYPTDFNGVLAGAPASIMTELNSVLHEYTFEANYTEPGYSGNTILDQPEANIVLNAAMQTCYPKVDDASSYVSRVSEAVQQPAPWLGKFDTTMIWCNNQGLDCKLTKT
jgi:hypothetical protein